MHCWRRRLWLSWYRVGAVLYFVEAHVLAVVLYKFYDVLGLVAGPWQHWTVD